MRGALQTSACFWRPWTYKVVHDFGHGADGYHPTGDLILDSTGNLYGTTPVAAPRDRVWSLKSCTNESVATRCSETENGKGTSSLVPLDLLRTKQAGAPQSNFAKVGYPHHHFETAPMYTANGSSDKRVNDALDPMPIVVKSVLAPSCTGKP